MERSVGTLCGANYELLLPQLALTSWLAYSGIVRSNKISLSAFVLRKGISTSLLDSLNRTNLVNSLAKPFLPRPVIWNIKLLDLLNNVVWLRCICAFVARKKGLIRIRTNSSSRATRITYYFQVRSRKFKNTGMTSAPNQKEGVVKTAAFKLNSSGDMWSKGPMTTY